MEIDIRNSRVPIKNKKLKNIITTENLKILTTNKEFEKIFKKTDNLRHF